MGNDYSNKVLDAIEIISNSTANKLRFDRTVIGKISQVVDLETGEYRAAINGADVVVYSLDVDKEYRVGDNVFVKIPEGDMTNKKYIDGKVSNKRMTQEQRTALSNVVETFGPAWEYQKDEEVGIQIGKKSVVIFEKDAADVLFAQYAKTATHIRLQAKFQTRLFEAHTSGNYGLRIHLLTKGDPIYFELDCDDFNGDPYNFVSWAPQEIIIPIQSDFLQGIQKIELFEEMTEEEIKQKNILIKDIGIQFVEIKDLTAYEYYLTYSSDNGVIFTADEETITITPKLYSLGNLVEGEVDYSLYKKVLSAVSAQAGIGPGWEWTTLAAPFEFKETECLWKDEYLIVANHKGAISKKEFSLYNNTSEYDFEIRQFSENEDIVLEVFSNKENGMVGVDVQWYITYPDGRFEPVAENGTSSRLSVQNLLNYTELQFSCSLAKESIVIGNLYWTIRTVEPQEELTVVFEGDQAFNYDANGDISAAIADSEKELAYKLIWADGTGAGYRVEWKGPDGAPIGPAAASPANSMLENLRIDDEEHLYYNISRKYKANAINNFVSVVITTINGKEYEYRKDILFTKDGDPGTNGTSYTCSIATSANKVWFTNGVTNSYRLVATVRKDGQIVSGDSYKWTGVNVELSTNNENAMITSITPNQTYYYVKLEVGVSGTTLYHYYPIDVAYGSITNNALVDMVRMPSYVMYEASGLYPKYYNGELQAIYNGDSATSYESTDSSLITIKDKQIRPVYQFQDGFKCGSIKCKFGSENNYVLRTIVLYINTYGNEAINGWDGQSIEYKNEKGETNYIYAPQIGAGEKDSSNRFTGVVMGKDMSQKQIGLYGYSSGTNTFGLKKDGTAFFGSGKGRIEIDGTKAEIAGGYKDKSNAMILRLYNEKGNSSTKAIEINKDTFYIRYDGELVAKKASVYGDIVATTGTIGGWGISSDGIRKEETHLSSKGVITTNAFKIDGRDDEGNAATGILGFITGADNNGKTSNIGIYSSDGGIILQSENSNVGLKAPGGTIVLAGDSLYCNIPKEKQRGIYARFA